MPKADDILKTALAEVGVTEYPPNSNNVKYNTEYYGHNVCDGVPTKNDKYPWCCVFVWWVFKHQTNFILKKTASCMNLGDWFKANGRWYTTPKVGDVVFFKFSTNSRWTNHVGIVKAVNGSTIETIEGNTSVNSDDNGGAVMVRTRTSNIVGYGRPAYDTVPTPTPVPKNYHYGLDVSACQTSVDFAKVKDAGYEFVLLRSTTKDGKPDTKFEKYWKDATNAGMKIEGVYKLCYAHSALDAQKEAEGVIKLLNGRKVDIWLDMENDGGQQIYSKDVIAVIITAFLTTCVNAGYDVGIYCNEDWYKNHIKDDIKNICRFWIARYGKNTGAIDEQYRPKCKGMVMWQFSSHGQIDGVKSSDHNYVDLDVRC